jgi:hypothetical protein
MKKMPVVPLWDSLKATGKPIGVDREAGVIKGYVVAQRGPFKSEGRGEFDDASLLSIVALMNAKPQGTKSRFGHPGMSDDGLGKFLGRSKDARIDGDRVRADLHLNPASRTTPHGDLGGHVMDLAESDPDALSSSLVLQVDREWRLASDGKSRKTDDRGQELPPIWRPKAIHASDIVDTGDAVDGLLSAGIDPDGLPLAALWRGAELLDSVFAGQEREAVEARCLSWLGRYLSRRYGEPALAGPGDLERLRRRLRLADATRPA